MYRRILSSIFALVVGLAFSVPGWPAVSLAAEGTPIPGGDVSGTWTAAGSPYLVGGDITVPAGQTLIIEPGVQVIFQSWYQFAVNGTLLAEGTASAPILFTSTDASTYWLGIRFVGASDSSQLSYAIVERGRASGASPFNSGGGIYVENSSPTISYSTIRDNFATKSGGGIYLTGSNAILIGNTIVDNQAGQGASASGGGIYMTTSNPELTGNVIRGNSVYVSGSFSTPTGLGGGIYAHRSSPVLRYNVISDNLVNAHLNSHARGGGLYFYVGSPDLVSNTISGNSVPDSGSVMYDREGGGLYLYGSSLSIVNNILWNDTPQEIFVSDYATLTVAYSDVQGGQGGIVIEGNPTVNTVGGNMDAAPLFVDAINGDYQLQESSPAIDAGTAFFEWQGRVLIDLAPDDYVGTAPDIGAFEQGDGGSQNQPPVAIASANPDHGSAPLTVQFSADGSHDPDGVIAAYAWDFGDGGTSTEANPVHTYAKVGTFQATLTITDDGGAAHSDVVPISVVDGTTIWGGEVSGTWDLAGSPYRIEGDVTVASGQTLTIEPGVVVNFESAYELRVNGTLLADGTEAAPIYFGGGHPTAGWGGIRFVGASDSSHLTYAIVEKGRATAVDSEKLGGGIYIENSSPTISYSTIRNNYATLGGGGIGLVNSNARLVGNTITNNQAGQGTSASGGGIYMSNSNPELTGNVIRGNWVYVSGSYGTPTGAGGGIFASGSNPILRDNLIADNRVDGHLNTNDRGGGLYLGNSAADLINNTIAGNTVGQDSGGPYAPNEGGAIYASGSEVTLVNTILWNNTPEQIFVSGSGVASTLTVSHSDVQGGQAGIVTNGNATINQLGGNIDADPFFVDPTNGDYQLQANSPAIDGGTAYLEWQGRVLVNLAPGDYLGTAPDMGAFEAAGSGPANQPPVAVASANPESGNAPLAVQFSADGSYDPDGLVAAYAWDFGDGATSAEASPIHAYSSAGIFQATLTVTDGAGATGSDTVAITVVQASQSELHVGNQLVMREKDRSSVRGLDTVLILDQDGQPVAGVTVTAVYSGPNSGEASGTTGDDGTVVLVTPWARKTKEVWCFKVMDVAKDGYVYNPAANVATNQCEAQ